MLTATAHAQQKGHEGHLFPRNVEDGSIELKWITNKVLYKDGFNLYKATGQNGSWVKLNETPFVRPDKLPAEVTSNDEHAEPIFMMFEQEESFEAFQEGLGRLFLMIQAVKNNEFARAIGLAYKDSEVNSGGVYKYRLTAMYNGQEIEIADTMITQGPFQLAAPPTGFEVERKKKKIEVRWDIDELSYYGVHVFRTNLQTGEVKQLTDEPIVLKKEDMKSPYGGFYPNYIDYEIDKETDYSYELKVMDFFGDIGAGTGPVSAPSKDFDPPIEPFGLQYKQDTLRVNLRWEALDDTDRVGFNLYRYSDTIINKVKINKTLIPADSMSFIDQVSIPGDYFYYVAATDLVGNEGNSYPIIANVRDVIPPLPATNLKTQTDSGKVILTWNPSPDEDLMGYVIYKVIEGEDVTENDYTLINDVPTMETMYTEKLHKNVKTTFRYVVEAVDTTYNRSEFSDFSVATLPDHLPPVNPVIRNVVLDESQKFVTIEWEKNADDDIYGYYIFRSEGADSLNGEKIELNLAPMLPSETVYEDDDIQPGKRYVYYVQAIDSARNRSGLSNSFSVTTPGISISDGLKMKKFSAKLKGAKNVDLRWKVNQPENVIGYVLFRKDGGENLMPLTGTMQTTKYRDKRLKAGIVYQYQLRIYAADGAIVRSDFKEFNIPVEEEEN